MDPINDPTDPRFWTQPEDVERLQAAWRSLYPETVVPYDDESYRTMRQVYNVPDVLPESPIGPVSQPTTRDTLTMYSPNDPLFWLHHGNVDKLLADWRALHPDAPLPQDAESFTELAKRYDVGPLTGEG